MNYTTKYNLHTHSFYCGHGSGEIKEYVEFAKSLNLEILGFSEHLPFENDKYFSSTRMKYVDRKNYEKDCRSFSQDTEIKVLVGYECDYLESEHAYFEKVKSEVDYLISGTHFLTKNGRTISPFTAKLDLQDMKQYQDKVITAIDTGLFSFIAHPDLYLFGSTWTDESAIIASNIINAAIKQNIPIEINGKGTTRIVNGIWAYPRKEFWSLAVEMGARIVTNTDAHEVEALGTCANNLVPFIKEMGAKITPCSFDDKLIFKN